MSFRLSIEKKAATLVISFTPIKCSFVSFDFSRFDRLWRGGGRRRGGGGCGDEIRPSHAARQLLLDGRHHRNHHSRGRSALHHLRRYFGHGTPRHGEPFGFMTEFQWCISLSHVHPLHRHFRVAVAERKKRRKKKDCHLR